MTIRIHAVRNRWLFGSSRCIDKALLWRLGYLPPFLLCPLLQEPYKAGAIVHRNVCVAPYCDFGHSFSDQVVRTKWTVVLDTRQEVWL